MKQYAHVASRVFETPLAIREGKLVDITGFLIPRFRGESADSGEGMEPVKRVPLHVEGGIAVIQICGTLVGRCSGMDAMSGLTGYPDIQSDFERAMNDASVRGILLDVDSPGGEVSGMYDLSDLIYKARGAKPIYAACDSYAASAAFVVCSAAERIFVKRTSVTGSIGIIALHLDQSGYDAKQGFKFTYVYAGARKKDANPHEPLSDEVLDRLQSRIDALYDLEVQTVARNRGLTDAAIRATEAGDYLGGEAIAVGLADEMGTLDDAARALSARLEKPKVSVLTARASSARAAIQPAGGTSVPDIEVPAAQAAQSAAIPQQEGNMPDPTPADTPAVPVAAIAAEAPSTVDVAAVIAKAKTEARTTVVGDFLAMLETCAIAGFSAKAALTHIKPESTLDSVRRSVLAARAEQGPEISSHITPEAGVDVKAKPEDSPVVKAAERRAALVASSQRSN